MIDVKLYILITNRIEYFLYELFFFFDNLYELFIHIKVKQIQRFKFIIQRMNSTPNQIVKKNLNNYKN